jgi:hypothetical protein
MLPRKQHIDEINRYHDTIENMRKQIDNETDKDKKAELTINYFKLVDIWSEIDDVVEFTIKHTLDCIENGDSDEV